MSIKAIGMKAFMFIADMIFHPKIIKFERSNINEYAK